MNFSALFSILLTLGLLLSEPINASTSSCREHLKTPIIVSGAASLFMGLAGVITLFPLDGGRLYPSDPDSNSTETPVPILATGERKTTGFAFLGTSGVLAAISVLFYCAYASHVPELSEEG